MSGIVGIINLDGQPVDRQLLRQMTDFMTYRGPDAQEIWVEGPVGLGHTLLQTTEDTLPECQPHTLDGQVWITADARIDGRADLISKLSGRVNATLENITDSELILHAYHVWGEDCLKHLLGDFVFAIWDSHKCRLFCARDHFGVKPFYYAQVGHSLVFSNTLNCLRLYPQLSDELNELAIADFLLFDFNQDQATTTFVGIKRIPPAHCLNWKKTGLKLSRYWTLPQDGPLRYPRHQDYVDHFKELLYQAVADRLRTHRVGVFMSGGLDSSIIAAMAKSLLAGQSPPFDLRAYTDVFDRLMPDRERYFAGLVAAYLSIPIHYHIEDDYKLYERADQPEMHCSEPYHYPQLASSLDMISRVRGHSRVIMTGQGGDPICSPSKSYFQGLLKDRRLGQIIKEVGQCVFKYRRLPRVGFRSSLRHRVKKNLPLYPPWLNQSFATRLNLANRWAQLTQPMKVYHPVREEACRIFLDPFWAHMFEKEYDAGATGLPVEFRHPFFDIRVVSFALALPPIPWCSDKILFREAGRGLLPEVVRCRPKTPLAANPERELVLQQGAGWLDRLRYVSELAAFVDSDAIGKIAGEIDVMKLWMNLRPRSLNYWLAYRSPLRANISL